MTKLRLARCDIDQAVFFRRETRRSIIVLVHIDDCTIAATSIFLIKNFKSEIAKHVKITDLGELHWLLGIKIKRNCENRTIHFSQCSYIEAILCCFNFQDLKPISTPMETHIKLSSSQSPATTAQFVQMHDVPYHEAVGSLMYTSLGTHPDISFAVQTLSRFSTKPGIAHWDAVKHVFRYLKGTIDLWLSFGQKQADLTGYADADGSMAEDRHAISGYAFIINGGTVSWSAKHQEIVSFIALPMTWLPTHSPNLSLQLKSNFLLPNLDSHCLEGECWISKDKLRVLFHLFRLMGGRFHCMYYISLHSYFHLLSMTFYLNTVVIYIVTVLVSYYTFLSMLSSRAISFVHLFVV